jgi:hypothetical protein
MADIVLTSSDIITFSAENAGVDFSITEPDTGDVVYVPNPSKSFYLIVINSSATNTPVLTVETPQTINDLEVDVDDYVYTCTTSNVAQIGPFTPSLFDTDSDDPVLGDAVKITVSGTVVSGELQLGFVNVQKV